MKESARRIEFCMNLGELKTKSVTSLVHSGPIEAVLEREDVVEMSHCLSPINQTVTRSATMTESKSIMDSAEKKGPQKTTESFSLLLPAPAESSAVSHSAETYATDSGCSKEFDSQTVKLQRDGSIRSISQRLASSHPQHEPPEMQRFVYPNVQTSVTGPRDEFDLPHALESIQRWIFTQGAELEDTEIFITHYAECVRSLGVPLERVYVGGVAFHPTESAYNWKWEMGLKFEEREIPRETFEDKLRIFGKDAPFSVLMHENCPFVRVRSTDSHIPAACNFMIKAGYYDYFALPVKHRGQFRGAIAWSTKDNNGFAPEHIQFFEKSMPALTTIIRTHTSDMVMSQLVDRLQSEVIGRTKELAKANHDLAQANRHIVNQSQAQLRHFAMMSHEIRTPLNGIIGLCSVLEETQLNEEQREILQTISTSGDLLQRVVDDVLDYSKLAAGRVEIDMQLLDLRSIIQPVVKSMSVKASENSITVQTTIDTNLPDKMYCDGRRIQQILYNLLGNAIKFSNPGGSVEFSVSSWKDAESTDCRVNFMVKDYGKGIAKQHIGSLFRPFLKTHGEKSKLYGGTGLGLAITSKLVAAHGGTIHVDSELSRWTEFNINLPCKSSFPSVKSDEHVPKVLCVEPLWYMRQNSAGKVEPATSSDASEDSAIQRSEPVIKTPDPHEISLENRKRSRTIEDIGPVVVPDTKKSRAGVKIVRILVAEDHEVNQKLMLRILSKIGAEDVDLVDNGAKAVDKTKEKEYDLILMDKEMPIMDGLQATRVIKSRCDVSSICPQIVFVSAHALKEVREAAMEAGADGFIPKPYNLGQIRNVVESVATRLAASKAEEAP